MARDTQEKQTSSRIVLEVVHDLHDKGYCLYVDNLYASPKLDNLCTRKTCWNHEDQYKSVPRFREEGKD